MATDRTLRTAKIRRPSTRAWRATYGRATRWALSVDAVGDTNRDGFDDFAFTRGGDQPAVQGAVYVMSGGSNYGTSVADIDRPALLDANLLDTLS